MEDKNNPSWVFKSYIIAPSLQGEVIVDNVKVFDTKESIPYN